MPPSDRIQYLLTKQPLTWVAATGGLRADNIRPYRRIRHSDTPFHQTANQRKRLRDENEEQQHERTASFYEKSSSQAIQRLHQVIKESAAFNPTPAFRQIEAQRKRVRFGKEEQGSGRMTFFISIEIKKRRSKANFVPTWYG